MINDHKHNYAQTYKLAIDARFYNMENKGLGRYTNELVNHLDDILYQEEKSAQECFCADKSNKSIQSFNAISTCYIFLRHDDFVNFQPRSKRIHKVKADFQWYTWQEQIKFPLLLRKYKPDLMHFPHFNVPLLYSGKFIVTIHDLILFHYPTIKNTTLNKFFYFFKLSAYHFLIRIVVKRAQQIIAISRFTKNDLIRTLKVKPEKIKVIYEGVEFYSLKFNKTTKTTEINDTDEIFQKYGIIKPYILYVGNAYPHKNLLKLIKAFSKACQEENTADFQLVLVGKKDYFYKRLKQYVNQNNIQNIVITDYMPDEELEIIYKKARAFIFPSLYEGFGLPPLEALVRDIPVVSSSAQPMPEVLKDKVTYFDPKDDKEMVLAIRNIFHNKNLKTISKQDQEKICQQFSWHKMAEEIYCMYKTILFK